MRRALALIPELLARRVAVAPRYASIRITGEVKFSAAISRRSAELYGMDGSASGTNVIISPNLETGNLLYHLYAARFPTAKKFPVLFGVAFRGVDLAIDCTPEDVRLAVKASVLRLQRAGRWTRTPKDTFFRRHRVLVLNPGSTSTKIAVYEGDQERVSREIKHTTEELAPFAGRRIAEQYQFRRDAVLKVLGEFGLSVTDFDAVCGRGGLLRPLPHGTYRVGQAILDDLRAGVGGDHASNLGALIAHELAAPAGKPAFIVDPVVVDEAPTRVKITGFKEIRRRVISHALNQVASARRFAQESETFYENVNVIVCHLGGGISVGAHCQGHYVDANNALDGEGPFTPERSGTLPAGQLADLCFSGRYTHAEVKRMIKGAGGLTALVGTSDLREIERRIAAGDAWAAEVFDALAYQVAKSAAALLPAFEGRKLDRIILTGGMARSQPLVAQRLALPGWPAVRDHRLPGRERDGGPGEGRPASVVREGRAARVPGRGGGAAVTEPFPYEAAVDERFVRASGPGGQNVNKVATAVELRFDVERAALPAEVKARLLALAGSRIAADGRVLIDSREHRTQVANRAAARDRLAGPDPPGQPEPAAPHGDAAEGLRARSAPRDQEEAGRGEGAARPQQPLGRLRAKRRPRARGPARSVKP